jgi:hypothetical protein
MSTTNGLDSIQNGTGFLSFNSSPPRLWITSEDEEFDETTIKHWKEEGYDVTYLPMGEDVKAYTNTLKSLADDLGISPVPNSSIYCETLTHHQRTRRRIRHNRLRRSRNNLPRRCLKTHAPLLRPHLLLPRHHSLPQPEIPIFPESNRASHTYTRFLPILSGIQV